MDQIADVYLEHGDGLRALDDVLAELPALIAEGAQAWESLDVNYEPPRVERLWRKHVVSSNWNAAVPPSNDIRVYLHRIHPCERALFHPHPWPSAIFVVSGEYEMALGGEKHCFARLRLGGGSAYEMLHPLGWHSVRPLDQPSLSVMITWEPFKNQAYDHSHFGKGRKHEVLGDEAKQSLLDDFALHLPASGSAVQALNNDLRQVKSGYHTLDRNWSAMHESFAGGIRMALDLPHGDLRELLERIDDLKAAERVAPRLHVFHNDCDWVIAYSVDDAWRLLTGMTGTERDEYSVDFEQLPDDDILPVMLYRDMRGPDIEGLEVEELEERNAFDIRVKTTCGDWCKRNGRGFLCSTEF